MGEAAAARCGVGLWSACTEPNSERDVHKVIRKQGTALNVPLSHLNVKGLDIPWISPRNWFAWLVKNGLWTHLAGVARSQYDAAGSMWSEFWRRYQNLHPHFGLFDIPNVDLSCCAAFLVHGDEGRTLKRSAIMVTSLQSALGSGYDTKRVGMVNQGALPLKVNYAGHSFTHRFISSALPKTIYEDDPEIFHGVMEEFALSLRSLLFDGVVDPMTNKTYRVAVIAVKGDAPYLVKMGRFYRSYNTTVKRGDERTVPKGVCHRCLAGCIGFPAEEIGTVNPRWLQTQGVRLPWTVTPAVIKHLVHDNTDPSTYFQTDIWHIVHLGFGRSWIASVIALTLEVLPCPNLEAKWDYLTDRYRGWCRRNHKQSHVSSITPYLMSYHDRTGAMGNWSKGMLTTNFMLFLVELLSSLPRDHRNRLELCQKATTWMNELFSCLYRADVFMTKEECEYVFQRGLAFLKAYEALAQSLFREDRPWLFPLYPKTHSFHEQMVTIKTNSDQHNMSINPMVYGCQCDEDTIGRAARLSRRVNVRMVMQRTMQRYLVSAYSVFSKANLLG